MFKTTMYYNAVGKISLAIILNSLQMFIRIIQDNLKFDNLLCQTHVQTHMLKWSNTVQKKSGQEFLYK